MNDLMISHLLQRQQFEALGRLDLFDGLSSAECEVLRILLPLMTQHLRDATARMLPTIAGNLV